MQQFLFTLTTVAPVFLIAFLGIGLKKIKLLDDHFVHTSSTLVFKVALPSLVFFKLASTDYSKILDIRQIGYLYAATLLSFFLTWFFARFWIKEEQDLGVFVQGSFRSNYSIVGFAIILNLMGENALTKASVILAFIMPLYNLLSILVLTVVMHQDGRQALKRIVNQIFLNPLIIVTILSVPFSLFKIPIHQIFTETGRYLASLTLPLALLGIGGSLNLESIKKASVMAFQAAVIKLILVPVVFTAGAVYLGYRGDDLGVMYILFACPTAVASFIMATAMQGNTKLAGNIVIMTTLVSSITITVGYYLLSVLGLL